MQAALNDEVGGRLRKAAEQLQDKYDKGLGGQDASVSGPTGDAYKQEQKEKAMRKKAKDAAKARAAQQNAKDPHAHINVDDIDDDEDDPDLLALKEARMKQLKQAHDAKLENIGKGHGQFREISQDEFLPEITGSQRVICHFYHGDFPRCTIMDHHLKRLSVRHVETKFVKLNADKAPFFVEKLSVRTIPTVVLFIDGIMRGKIIGFDGLTEGLEPGKEDEWKTITLANMLGDVNMIDSDNIVDEDAQQAAQLSKYEEMRRNIIKTSTLALDDDEDDFDLDNV